MTLPALAGPQSRFPRLPERHRPKARVKRQNSREEPAHPSVFRPADDAIESPERGEARPTTARTSTREQGEPRHESPSPALCRALARNRSRCRTIKRQGLVPGSWCLLPVASCFVPDAMAGNAEPEPAVVPRSRLEQTGTFGPAVLRIARMMTGGRVRTPFNLSVDRVDKACRPRQFGLFRIGCSG